MRSLTRTGALPNPLPKESEKDFKLKFFAAVRQLKLADNKNAALNLRTPRYVEKQGEFVLVAAAAFDAHATVGGHGTDSRASRSEVNCDLAANASLDGHWKINAQMSVHSAGFQMS